jgi:hypothetical protein
MTQTRLSQLIEGCEVAEGIARENDQIGVKACRELTGSP